MSSATVLHSVTAQRRRKRTGSDKLSSQSARKKKRAPASKSLTSSISTLPAVLDRELFNTTNQDSPNEEDTSVAPNQELASSKNNNESANIFVDWNGQSFQVPNVKLGDNPQEILKLAKEMSHYQDALDSCQCPLQKAALQEQLEKLFAILNTIFSKLVNNAEYKPSSLDKNQPLVVYACCKVLKSGSVRIKVGKTVNQEERMKYNFNGNQYTFAMTLATLDEIKQLIDPQDIQDIVKLGFPTFESHPDFQHLAVDEIYLYVYEAFMACAIQGTNKIKCITNTILERFVQPHMTGAQLLSNVRVHKNGRMVQAPPSSPSNPTANADFVANQVKTFFFGNGGSVPEDLFIKLLFTWATTKSILHEIAPNYVGDILKALPEGEFLTLYLLVFGAFHGCNWQYQNVNRASPNLVILENVVRQLCQLGENATRDQIETILRPLENGTYIRPTGPDQANAFAAGYQQWVDQNTPSTIHYVEQCQIDAIQQHRTTFFQQEFGQGSSSLQVGGFFTCYKTSSNLRFIVTGSTFKAYSHEPCPLNSRIHLLQSNLVLQEIMRAIGVANDDNVRQQFQAAMEAYLGSLEFALQSGDHQWPRRSAIMALPDGYLKSGFNNVKAVASNICFGLECADFVYIQVQMLRRAQLGKFLLFLEKVGINLDNVVNPHAPVPSVPGFVCPGLPQTTNFDARACQYIGGREGGSYTMYCSFIESECQTIAGRIVCRGCHRRMEDRERDVLRNLDVLSVQLSLRLTFLESRTRTQHRNQQIAARGWQSVREAERYIACLHDSEQNWATRRARSSVRDKGRMDNRSGTRMQDTTQIGIIDYSDRVQEVLRMAVLILFQHYPIRMDNGNEPRGIPQQTLFKTLTDVIQEVIPRTNYPRTYSQDNRIKYREPGFQRALRETLNPVSLRIPGSKLWEVKANYLEFVDMDQRPDFHGKLVLTEIIPNVVTIVRNELNQFGF